MKTKEMSEYKMGHLTERNKNERKIVFPFTAIVEQEKAKLALLCCAVDPTIGGVLLTGEKGTGKSTIVRALSYVLPEVKVVAQCPFNCNPYHHLEMCDSCYGTTIEGQKLKISSKRMRVVDLPLTVTVDRLVGTLNIKKALTQGVRALELGILAEANRNILYIDEVNLLDDYVADVLLDAAAMGWNIIEREGISVKHPARFILVGSMNPEEGELRPQLLDRFGLYVNIEALEKFEERIEVIRRVEKFHKNPDKFYLEYEREENTIRKAVTDARKIIDTIIINDELLNSLIKSIMKLGIKTHRAEIVTVKTAKAIAALDGRRDVTLEDIKKAMELALPHRLRTNPFDNIAPQEMIEKITKDMESNKNEEEKQEGRNEETKAEREVKKKPNDIDNNKMGEHEETFESAKTDIEIKKKIQQAHENLSDEHTWRGSRSARITTVGSLQGHPVSYVPPNKKEQLRDIDISGTLCAAIGNMKKLPLRITDDEIRVKVRKQQLPKLTLIILDSSGSMGLQRRISVAKGLAEKFVEKAYVKRDYIGMIAFRGKKANVTVPPTRDYCRVIDALKTLPTGGRTPLASGFQSLLSITKKFRNKNRKSIVEALLITDGKANTSLQNKSIKKEIEELSQTINKEKIKMTIFDTRNKKGIDPAPSYLELITQHTRAEIIRI